LAAARVTATAEAAGAERALAPLEPFEVRRVELVLETGRRLVGIVVDPHGEPVPYATLTATDFADTVVARARSDRQGRFWLKEVPFTPVTVVADDGDGGVGSLYVEASGAHADLVVMLQPAGRVTVDYRGPFVGTFEVYAFAEGDQDRPSPVAQLRGNGDVVVLPAPRKYWVVYGEEQRLCGTVLLTPGEVATVRCGEERPATVVGRLVDADGAPVAGGSVGMRAMDGRVERTTAGPDGRFALSMAVGETLGVELAAYAHAGTYLPTRRRNVPLSPGETTDLGDLRLDRVDDFPDLGSRTPFGGLGAQIQAVEDGIALGRIVKGGPLDVAGVEAGEIIVAIDEAASGFLPALDAVRLLRGAPGSSIRLRLRKADGSTHEVDVERSVIDVESAGWVN
ncbi:MAG: PDZ domain-containing protein, partial [Deltaproteobacteria bacterium]